MGKNLIVTGAIILSIWGGPVSATSTEYLTVYPDETISKNYIGNGVQWDPYQLDYGHGRLKISDDDWNKIGKRLDYMHPEFIRIMINTPRNNNKEFDKGYEKVETLSEILDYCQSRNVTVMFGDWGGGFINFQSHETNSENIKNAVNFLKSIVEAGYDCIKYYNFINEPNGWWSVTKGDFNLWIEGISKFYSYLEEFNLTGKIHIVGPDIAIWGKDENWWISRSDSILKSQIGLFDIHTYPSKYTVNSGEYYDIIKSYRDITPPDKQIVMGEIGLKYIHPKDSLLNIINIERASNHTFASVDDSQMSVYDFGYGIDVADALMQTVSAGYSGSIAWMLDDAMHSKEAPDKLKIWGMWNILGDDFFGTEEENIRPWYYAWSLLCRYMPAGCNVLKTSRNDRIRINAIERDGEKSIFLLNPTDELQEISLRFDGNFIMNNARVYVYNEDIFNDYLKDNQLLPVENNLMICNQEEYHTVLPPQTMKVITNFDF